MLRSQRILVTLGLLFLAWLLHVNLCEWMFKERLPWVREGDISRYVHTIICVWTHEQPPSTTQARLSPQAYTGLVTQARVDRADAVVFGMALPLTLVMLVMYLWLGWRRDARRRRGLCEACGYDLRGASRTDAPCPECGTIRKAATAGAASADLS
jgi:predicted RNA-binding Zn-ribbon protein involved in translation (DUF1610 family)